MLKRFFKFLLIVPISVLLIVLAVGNRHVVRLGLDPLSPENPVLALDAPFFVYLFGALMIGVLLGGVASWFGQGKWRKAARQRSFEAQEWRKEAERLSREMASQSRNALPSPK